MGYDTQRQKYARSGPLQKVFGNPCLDRLLWLRKKSGSTGSMEVAARSSLLPTMHKAEVHRREG